MTNQFKEALSDTACQLASHVLNLKLEREKDKNLYCELVFKEAHEKTVLKRMCCSPAWYAQYEIEEAEANYEQTYNQLSAIIDKIDKLDEAIQMMEATCGIIDDLTV